MEQVKPDAEWPNDPCWRFVELIRKDGGIEYHFLIAANSRDAFLQVCGDRLRLHEIKELFSMPSSEMNCEQLGQ